MQHLKVIAFDADDTLWVNEPYFRETEDKFCALLEDFMPLHTAQKALFQMEMKNLKLYGYGVKGFMLSMIESALEISNHQANPVVYDKILAFGKELLEKPIELLPGVKEVLEKLQPHYRIVVATKGDLLDQERKLKKSGLEKYFHHIEIMSDKQVADYEKLIRHLDIQPSEFMMIGNSLKSDVLPVLEMGGYGVHVPFHTIWEHERIDHQVEHENFIQVEHANELLSVLIKP